MTDYLPDFIYDGRRWSAWTEAAALASGVPQSVLDACKRARLHCTPRQARRALDAAGLLDSVETYIAGAPKSVQIDWEYADVFRRDYGAITTAGAALGLSESQIDDLFTAAMAINGDS